MTKLEEKMWNDDIDFITMLRKENEELKNRMDKAIEYVKDNNITGIDIYCAEQLEKILKY